jgi:hypothetical protein
MAKTSKIAAQQRRERIVARYAADRAELKERIRRSESAQDRTSDLENLTAFSAPKGHAPPVEQLRYSASPLSAWRTLASPEPAMRVNVR